MGWVNRRRDMGNLIFVDVRDRTGLTQLVFDKSDSPALHEKASGLRSEFVIGAVGKVRRREEKTINRNLPTGEIEVTVSELKLLNEAKSPPFLPSDPALANEEIRLKYRYLDLRREPMQYNVELRHKVALAIRQYLSSQGFFEIETPFMTRSTPEGARDYLVPSRVYPGKFYALPQSPQLFKQILMISGFDKYFQIVRCFRDEDLRADRQPEFTQIDLEMSFPQIDRVFAVVEGFLQAAWKAAGYEIKPPFPRMTYDQAIREYGIDKPDLRLPKLTDVRAAFAADQLQTLQLNPELPVVAIRIPKIGELSRKERDENRPLFGERKEARLIDDLKRLEKSFPEAVAKVRELSGASTPSGAKAASSGGPGAQPEDLLVLIGGPLQVEKTGLRADYGVLTAAGAFRVELA